MTDSAQINAETNLFLNELPTTRTARVAAHAHKTGLAAVLRLPGARLTRSEMDGFDGCIELLHHVTVPTKSGDVVVRATIYWLAGSFEPSRGAYPVAGARAADVEAVRSVYESAYSTVVEIL